MANLSDQEILSLWKNPTFSGSFSGIKTFQSLLKTDYNIDISQSKLYKILQKEKIYLIHLKKEKRFPRRKYDLNFYGQLTQADIGYMFDFEGFKYFLLLVDCYSNKIFAEPLKGLSAEEVLECFKKIFSDFQAPIYELQTDKGFTGRLYAQYMKKNNILLRFKSGANKANFAELGILNVKRKLYKALRSSLSQDWPNLLPQIVKNQNALPLARLGNKSPNEVTNIFDSVKIQDFQKNSNFKKYKEPTYKEQQQNQENYEKNSDGLKVGDFVYRNFEENLFGKSFDVQVSFV